MVVVLHDDSSWLWYRMMAAHGRGIAYGHGIAHGRGIACGRGIAHGRVTNRPNLVRRCRAITKIQ